MAFNIKIKRADLGPLAGQIEFTTNFTRRHLLLRFAASSGWSVEDLDHPESGPRPFTIGDMLAILNQGDPAAWTWQTFLAACSGWSDGFDAGRDFQEARQHARERAARSQEPAA